MFAPMFEDMFQPMFSDLFGLSKICQAIRFNGVNNYGQLAQRAIDPDGDIDIEWYQIGFNSAATRALVTQSDSASIASREIVLRWNNSLLEFFVGGSPVLFTTDGIQPSDGAWRVVLVGNSVTVYLNENEIFTVSNRARGSAREPSAPTRIGVRNNGGSLLEHFLGILAWVKINDTYYPLADAGQAIQIPTPSGLGEELFVNPSFANNAASWLRTSGGEAESISGGVRVFNTQTQAGRIFQTVATTAGVKYVVRVNQFQQSSVACRVSVNNGNTSSYTGSILNRNVTSSEVGQILFIEFTALSSQTTIAFIVNDSALGREIFINSVEAKPLGTSNPMTLFNTVPEQWEQIACDLRPDVTPQALQTFDGANVFTQDGQAVQVIDL